MVSDIQNEPLGDVVDLLPGQLDDSDVRRRLRKMATQLDLLLVTDDSGDVFVDRAVLAKTVQDEDLFPAALQDLITQELQARLGERTRDRGNARSFHWRELVTRPDISASPERHAELRQQGIKDSSTTDDLRTTLRTHYPDIPNFWLDAEGSQVKETTLQALSHNQSVWDCCVRHLGVWGALWVFAAVGAALIVGTATGPWGLALAVWLIAVLGGGTGVIVFNCLLNPSWG